jgi:hypothetical protein
MLKLIQEKMAKRYKIVLILPMTKDEVMDFDVYQDQSILFHEKEFEYWLQTLKKHLMFLIKIKHSKNLKLTYE